MFLSHVTSTDVSLVYTACVGGNYKHSMSSWGEFKTHIYTFKRHYILKWLLWALESVLLDIPTPSYYVLPFPRCTQSAVRIPRTEKASWQWRESGVMTGGFLEAGLEVSLEELRMSVREWWMMCVGVLGTCQGRGWRESQLKDANASQAGDQYGHAAEEWGIRSELHMGISGREPTINYPVRCWEFRMTLHVLKEML